MLNDNRYFGRAEIIREKGTNRSQFFRGQVDKYTWVDKGSSYVISDILAAFLYSQLKNADYIQRMRRNIWESYRNELQVWADNNGFSLPVVPDYCEQPYHLFYLLAPDESTRDALINYLSDKGICAVFHYIPLHSSPYGCQLTNTKRVHHCPISEDVSVRLLRLPMYVQMTYEEQQFVTNQVKSFSLRNE